MSNCRLIKKLKKLLNIKCYVILGISKIHKSYNQPSTGLNICERHTSSRRQLIKLSIRVIVGLQAKTSTSINNPSVYFI